MTGPYHTISSLYHVLPKHNEIREAVFVNKERFLTNFSDELIYSKEHQPQLCTYVDCKIESNDESVILYKPRSELKGSVICHLGEVHLGKKAAGDIQNSIFISKENDNPKFGNE
jgi:2-aminoethylphosphonate-pyruvate transaminase